MYLTAKKNLHITLILLVFFIFCQQEGAYAENDSSFLPLIESAIIHNNARITFEWPNPVNFTATAKGKKLTITFDRKANPDFGALLSSLYPYVISADRKSNGKTIVLMLDKPYKVRTFLSDNIGGVELLNIDLKKRHMTTANNALSNLAPSAGADAATSTADATKSDNQSLPAANATENAAAPPTPAQAKTAAPPGPVKISLSASEDSATLRFPFTERMAIAVFVRHNDLWIVLDKPVALDLSDFKDLPKTVVGKAELLRGNKTILHMPLLDDTVRPSVAKEENSFEWAVLLTSTQKQPANPLKVNINTDPPAPPHVFISSLEMGDPVSMRDPVVGDEMVVTPLFKPGEAINLMRDFVEFTLLETAQGIVVAKKADAVSVQPLRNGLRISLPQGATLTPGLPEVGKDVRPQALQNVATFYPYADWKLDPAVPRAKQLKASFHQIVESTDPRDANEHRVHMAQIYLGEGMAAEAIGFIDGISRTNPVYYKSAKLAALRGAANFLMSRYAEAMRDFSASELSHNKEMDFWRNMLADLNGKTGQYDYLEMNNDYISKYPPLFRQRIAVVAADRAVDAKEYNSALKIFETLRTPKDKDIAATENATKDSAAKDSAAKDTERDDIIGPITPYINYLLAKISVDTDQLQDGLTTWNGLAEDYIHPYVQARAEFSRVVWEVNHSALTKTQAADRLERLRLIWHGDALELKIITLLGDLYYDQKDYINAMRIWDDGISSFPDTATAQEMTHRMQEAFILMFGEGSADTLSNLAALNLYYQYKSYAPPGSVGTEMIERLANRLIALDLLDQAASLLEHEMHFEAEKVQRSQLGAKVATIHLLNHQPKKALEALQDSVYGENPAQLRQLRNRLAAQALYEQGENDRAWLILGQDSSVDGDRIRLNIYWERKDWKQVITIVEAMLKNRKDLTAPVTVEESEYVLKLALAYIFENNAVQLQYLHDYFEPLMASNPNKEIFDYVTAADVAPTPGNFDEILRKLSTTRSFIDNYKARIKLNGLDTIVPPLNKK